MTGIPRRALITGSAKRVGKAMALALASQGWDIAIHYRGSHEEAEATAAEIRKLGRAVALVRADLSVVSEVEQIVPTAAQALGPLGVLVNSAAIFEFDRLATMTLENWQGHMAVNLRAPALLSKAFAAQLPKGSIGVIVNIMDERVLNLTPNYLSYSVSKMGLWGLTQVLARDLAPRIRVNAIGPGPALPGGTLTQERFDAFSSSLPLERGTSPEDVAKALLFLVDTPSITGQMITVDGGQQLGWLAPSMKNGS